LCAGPADAQNIFQENFTGTSTTNQWYYARGACLTAGSGTSTSGLGSPPSCTSINASYYQGVFPYYWSLGLPSEAQVGGVNGVSGTAGTLPDPVGQGALRFTNGYPFGLGESGTILSAGTFSAATGIDLTFETVSYRGDSGSIGCWAGDSCTGGTGKTQGDGADGMSFVLLDGSAPVSTTGNNLGNTCSNGGDGIVGEYVSLGIDEYGNLLQGVNLMPNTPAPVAGPGIGEFTYVPIVWNVTNPDGNYPYPGTGPAYGYGFHPNRIGLRGAGSVAWSVLHAKYPQYYPSSYPSTGPLTPAQQQAEVGNTCANGYVLDYSQSPYSSCPTGYNSTPSNPPAFVNQHYKANCPAIKQASDLASGGLPPFYDYAPLNNAYALLPSNLNLANESAMKRGDAQPIIYHLTITPAGLLTFAYSYNGGAYTSVLSQQNITNSNGSLPSSLRFGFSAGAGGHSNIHELMCFQANPVTVSQSSATGNQKQSAPVVQGTQVYFSFYDPTTWAGSVTSQTLLVDANQNVYFATLANWDAACVLTGVASGSSCVKTGVAGPTAAEPPLAANNGMAARTILTYSGTAGIPFEWSSLTSAQQTALDAGDGTSTAYRLNYLRGDRTNEQTSSGTGALTATGYRDRVSVLADVIDASPTWVGPPSTAYPEVWADLYDGGTQPENSGQAYSAFVAQEQTRLNVVYAGANDGMLHGFRSGSYDVNGNYVGTGSGTSFAGTLNDGYEVLAYMPAYVLNNIHSTTVTNDYSNVQYGHSFDVDATPGTGDVFYGGKWHTLLVGGLGPGGAAIYALDITNPADSSVTSDPVFSESNAASIVIGEWSTTSTTVAGKTTTTSTLTCAGASSNASTTPGNCGQNLGNSYGTPQIRRFHNGQWGAVFGNGIGSATGDGGIYVMLFDKTSGVPSFYYFSSGTSGKSNGIAYTSAVDLDGDHVTDYVYAGDLLGNVWRFDLTNASASAWTVSMNNSTPQPLFTTASGQPITTKLMVTSIASSPTRRILVEFGTGQQTPLTNTSAAAYSTTQQALYGIWDWNLAAWNAKSTVQFAALSSSVAVNGVYAPASIAIANLQKQTFTSVSSGGADYRTVSTNAVCWAAAGATTACPTGTQYGWYLPLAVGYANSSDVNLPTATGAAPTPMVAEQVIYNPTLIGDSLIVNTTIPPSAALLSCFSTIAGGFTVAISPATGGAPTQSVFSHNGQFTNLNGGIVSGLGQSGTGTVLIVTSGTGAALRNYLATQTVSGSPTAERVNLPNNLSSTRLTWIERR
jgi:type IV pilus assembly protein PilY1